DELLQAQYAEADPQKRCQIWRQLNQILVDDVPSHFMWTHKLITGVRANVDIDIESSRQMWLPSPKMRRGSHAWPGPTHKRKKSSGQSRCVWRASCRSSSSLRWFCLYCCGSRPATPPIYSCLTKQPRRKLPASASVGDSTDRYWSNTRAFSSMS